MRKAAENTDCHIIKDPANVILRAAPKMKAFNEEGEEQTYEVHHESGKGEFGHEWNHPGALMRSTGAGPHSLNAALSYHIVPCTFLSLLPAQTPVSLWEGYFCYLIWVTQPREVRKLGRL